ncbi:MAG: tetratricopeptide repeat protein, partial [Bacteroidales bacterium]
MKKLNYLALFTFAAILISSCGGLNKMQEAASDVSYTVTPEVLEEHGDQVDVKIDVKYPEKYFNKNAILTVTPVLKYEGGETAYEPKTVQGEKVEANNQVISSDGGSVSYSSTVPFTEEMMLSDLVVRVSAELKGNEATFPDYKIAEGVIATPKLVVVDPKPVMVGDKYQRIVPDSYKADINYVINRAEVRMSELKKEDVAGLTDYLKKADTHERMDLKGVQLSAYASPDGPVDFNDNLAQKRQSSAQRYFDRETKQAEIEAAAKEGFLAMNYTAEDWEGFKELMEESDIQDKELILRVLSMYSDPVVREREIKNISEAFEVIADEILPELRRSKFVVNVDKIGLSDDEIKSVWSSDPDSLNLEEILYAASLYDDLDTKLAIYKKASDNHPKCFRAINNVGYVYVLMGDADNAE